MQILIYVMTMLMLLSILTYARVDAYRNFSAIRAQFEQYSTKAERVFTSKRAGKWYDSTTVSKKEKETLDNEKKIRSFSKLSIYPLIDSKARESDVEEKKREQKVRLVLKNLIDSLYGETNFYRQVVENDPDVTNLLIDSIMSAADKLPKKQPISSPADLANLHLGNPQLNEVFYKMLKGTQKGDGAKVDNSQSYASLLNFISITKKANLSIYLASRKLLLALTNDASLTDRILQRRKALYAEVNADGAPDNVKELASKHLKEEFEGSFGAAADNFLDFSVTKTNPADYE